MAARKNTESTEEKAATFTKAQLLDSKRYANRRDLLAALLEDSEQYSLAGVDALIVGFMKGKVV